MIRLAFNSVRDGLSLVRWSRFDVSTSEGRSRERFRRLGLTSLSSIAGKFANLLAPLVSIPITLDYLGAERMGLWVAVVSVLGILAFAELGIGDALITLISRSEGEGKPEIAQRLVTNGLLLLLGVAIAVLAVHGCVAAWIPWPEWFNLTSPRAVLEAGPAMLACVVCFAVNLPLTLVQRAQAGYQEGFWTNLWVTAGRLAALIALIVAVRVQMSLPGLVWVYCGIPVFFSLLNAVQFFGWQRPWLRPRWANVNGLVAVRLLRRGFWFLWISMLSGVAMESDSLLVARVLGPEAVTQLYVPARLFAVIGSLAMVFYLPMWGANAEALARGDIDWVRKSLWRLTAMGALVLSALALGLVLGGVQLVNWWVGGALVVPTSLLSGLAAWSVLSALVGPGFMVLNAAEVLRPQVLLYGTFVLVALPAKILLAPVLGIAGIAWINAGVFAVGVALPLAVILRRLLASWRSGNGTPVREVQTR